MSGVRGAVIAVAVVGLVSAVGAAVAAIVLADIFRPHAPGGDLSSLPAEAARSAQWTSWHWRASTGLLATATAGLLLVLWLIYGRKQVVAHKMVVIAASTVALGAAVVSVLTRGMVEWDQLALRSVTVGSQITGYWFAAFGEDVLFILVGGSEVSQREYVPALLVHLGAPMAAGAALLLVVAALIRTPATAADRS